MNNRQTTLGVVLLVILMAMALVGVTWANLRYASSNPGGNDFLPRWLGARLFMLRGQSPYSQETTREIQQMIFGRPAQGDEDQSLYVYPFHSFLIFAPFAAIPNYPLARALWMTTLEVAVVLLTVMGISLSRWRVPGWLFVVLFIFGVLWYHAVRPVILGNVSVLIAFYVTAAFLAIRSEQDVLAGALLALATIKPQMVVLLIAFICLWAFSHRRWTLIWTFFSSLGILLAISLFLLPGWLMENLRQVVAYASYTLPGTPGSIFTQWFPGIGRQLGLAFTIFAAGVLFWEWRAALGKEFSWFLWTAYLTLVLTNLIGMRTATENYLAMYPALILVLAIWDQRWGRLGRLMIILGLIALSFGLWWLFLITLQPAQGGQPTQHLIMFFPLPFFLLMGLYWVRWWATRPPRPLLEAIKSSPDFEL